MKIYGLLTVVLCIPGLIMSMKGHGQENSWTMDYEAIKGKISQLYDIVDSSGAI